MLRTVNCATFTVAQSDAEPSVEGTNVAPGSPEIQTSLDPPLQTQRLNVEHAIPRKWNRCARLHSDRHRSCLRPTFDDEDWRRPDGQQDVADRTLSEEE
jgi:hypothetical protein